jgi:dihydroxyacetone kinase-like protein
MVARRGKSSYARQKSLGFIDPGAASIALMIRAAARSLDPSSTVTAASAQSPGPA